MSRRSKNNIKRLSGDSYLLKDQETLITFTNFPVDGEDEGSLVKIRTGGDDMPEIWYWGKANDLPTRREAIVRNNNIVGQLIGTKRNIVLGNGLVAFKEHFEDGEIRKEYVPYPDGAQEFFDHVNIKKYLRKACKNLLFQANVFTEFTRNLGGDIRSIRVHDCQKMRAERQTSSGHINNYFWSGKWHKKNDPENKIVKIPAYKFKEERRQPKFILHTLDELIHDDYYGIPVWWGDRNWIALSNCIPIFHIANLKHGYTIRYHIEVPFDYFKDYSTDNNTPKQKAAAKKKEETAKQDFIDNINEFLASAENAGRAVFTQYEINRALGKEFPGIKITPLKVDMKDEALLKLFEKSNEANISAQGVHPTLAAIQTQGKLSSGSEIRNAFIMYVAIHAPQLRDILLEPIELVHKINGWDPEIKWGFRDIEITDLAENKEGKKEVSVD